ncbi:hypothetical protein [Frondihabitans sp. PAMC 28766]|uniref:hypothetical protein n=1 Tax=Frondihabitans sp. PAMC 28766 TaxID=1795630 RepID=UPI0012FFBC11|nr:hypothetical protein [Frondihabitans sp. PAMC 28766]
MTSLAVAHTLLMLRALPLAASVAGPQAKVVPFLVIVACIGVAVWFSRRRNNRR